jgi:hypothetical protein
MVGASVPLAILCSSLGKGRTGMLNGETFSESLDRLAATSL